VDGMVTEYPIPTEDAMEDGQGFVGLGPDGAIWFNEDRVNKLGRIALDGTITEYELPQGTAPIRQMVAGADGALWVTAIDANKIVKLSTAGKVLAEYTLPNPDSFPVGMVVGPDGAFWFVENGANQIGRITLDGVITEYAIPTANSVPIRLTVGPDNALWFTMAGANKIGRISVEGKVTEYDVAGMQPVGIAAGADGALWFTGYRSTEIGRLTTDGVLTKLSIPTYAAVPYHIVAGPDGNLWFTEQQGNQIGQIKLPAVTAAQASASGPLTATVIAEWQINMPEDIVFGFDSVWVPSRRSPTVTTRIDPLTNQIVAVIPGTGMYSKSATVTGDAVWIAGQRDDLTSIDPKTNLVGTKVPGNHPRLAFGFDSIWAVGHQGEPLDRVDPATSKIIASIQLDGKVSDSSEENDVLVTRAAVWVISNGELIKIDPTTNSVVLRTTFDKVVEEANAQTTVPAGKGSDFIWWSLDQGLVRIDPNTGVGLTLLSTISGYVSIAVTDDALWVADDKGLLSRVNVATNQIDATYKVSPGASRVVVGLGSLWLAYTDATLVQRLAIAP